MSASAAGTSVRVVTSRWFQGRRPQQLAAAGGICLLSSALAVQQSAGDVQGFSRLESAAPAVVAAAGISRPNFGIHQAKNKDELKHHSTGASTPKARVPRVLHGGEESSAPPTSSSPSPLSLDRLDLMDLKKDEALQVLEHIHSGGRIDLDDLAKICQATTLLLKQEPTLIDKRGIDLVTVVGDLHGSLASLKKVLELVGGIEDDSDRCIVFDGDFVDRGDESVEVLVTLLLLKIAYPDRVVLLRGNHEDSIVAQVYGFADELLSKYTLSDDAEGQAALKNVWDPISEIFAALPMGVVTDTAFIVHGGLPSNDFRLDQLRQLTVQDRSQYHTLVHPKTPTEQMMGGLLWSDPHRRPGIHANHIRGKGVLFGPDIAKDFLTRENLKYLIRGHEEVKCGYKEMACGSGKSVITVFSAVDYEAGHNLGSIVNLTSDGNHTAITFDLVDSNHLEDSSSSMHSSSAPMSLLQRFETLSQPFVAPFRRMDDKQQ